MHFTPSDSEVCFSSVFYSNQLQLLISPCLPVLNSTTSPILLLLCLSTFVLLTFTTPEGTSNSLFMVGEGLNALSRLVFPELHCVKILPFNGMHSSVCQFQEQIVLQYLCSKHISGRIPTLACTPSGFLGVDNSLQLCSFHNHRHFKPPACVTHRLKSLSPFRNMYRVTSTTSDCGFLPLIGAKFKKGCQHSDGLES